MGSLPKRANFECFNEKTLKEKLESLSPRQKAFLTDFLNVSNEDRDLVVDVGNNLLSYFRQKGMKI